LEITRFILGFLGKSDKYIEYIADRPGHDRRYSLDSSKLRRLGWRPRWRFERALSETIQWYIFNRSWWQRIKSGQYLKYYQKQYKGLQ
jgi:dTDP-glucose 4,6-dehydratase